LGRNVTLFCNFSSLANVLQITWQKIQGSLPHNIGTYSHTYGEKILPPYVNRLQCKTLEPSASFMTIQGVTFEDEACYKCLFNIFPRGSHGGQTCLTILSIEPLSQGSYYGGIPHGVIALAFKDVVQKRKAI
jgi:CD200 antigen